MAIQVLISKSLQSKEGKILFRQTNAFAFLCSSLPTAASFPIKMNSNQVQKRKKCGSAKLSRWANGKKNKRRAVVPVQDVADVAMAEQAPLDAADPISINLFRPEAIGNNLVPSLQILLKWIRGEQTRKGRCAKEVRN